MPIRVILLGPVGIVLVRFPRLLFEAPPCLERLLQFLHPFYAAFDFLSLLRGHRVHRLDAPLDGHWLAVWAQARTTLAACGVELVSSGRIADAAGKACEHSAAAFV